MEKLEVLDAPIQSSAGFKASNDVDNDSAFYEDVLLEEMDSYWDELGSRLAVSRMVNDSVIKGIVNAVAEEAAEKITAKEAEVASLKKRLELYERDAVKSNEFRLSVMQMKASEFGIFENFESLKIKAEEQLQKLKDEIEDMKSISSRRRNNLVFQDVDSCVDDCQGLVPGKLAMLVETADSLKGILESVFENISGMFFSGKDSAYELQREWELQRVDAETKLCEQLNSLSHHNSNLLRKFDEISSLRKELDAISMSLISYEMGHSYSQGTSDGFEERNSIKRKEHFPRKISGDHYGPYASHPEETGAISSGKSDKPMLETVDSSILLHMNKDELISYHKNSITMMKMQHELSLQKATEDLFSLKRELLNLKERGPSTYRKDKEFDILRKTISDFIAKLDGILLEKDNLSVAQGGHENICGYKYRIDDLLRKNQQLQDLLNGKRKEVKHLSSRVSDAEKQISHLSFLEANFVQQIKKLTVDIEDAEIQATIREDLYKTILNELRGENKYNMEDEEMMTEFVYDIYANIFRESVFDAMSTMSPITTKYDNERKLIEANLLEKEKILSIVVAEKENLKQVIASQLALLEEKDKCASDAGIMLVQQKDLFDSVCQELDTLRDQVTEKERVILENRRKSDLVKRRLEETLEQVHQSEVEISKLSQELEIASNYLKEAEKEKAILQGIIQDEQNKVSSLRKQIESMFTFGQELSKAIAKFESRLNMKIKKSDSRLEKLSCQCKPLIQRASFLRRKEFLYVRNLDNLQKAEIEVDLLADEVEALVGILEKIYIALDHYSPVLQHYSGVMEILNLVKKELKGHWKVQGAHSSAV